MERGRRKAGGPDIRDEREGIRGRKEKEEFQSNVWVAVPGRTPGLRFGLVP